MRCACHATGSGRGVSLLGTGRGGIVARWRTARWKPYPVDPPQADATSVAPSWGRTSGAGWRRTPARAVSIIDGWAGLRGGWDPLRIALFLLTVLTVSRAHGHYPALAQMRPALLLTALAVGYALLRPEILSARNTLRYWPGRVVLALVVLACVGVPFGISPGNAGRFVLDVYLKNLVFAFLVAAVIRSARDLYRAVWAYVAGAAVLCWMALGVFQLTEYGDYSRLADLYAYDSNDAGLVLLVGLPLALLTLQSSGWIGRLVSLITIVAIGAAIARTGSRGALIGGAVILTVLLTTEHRVSALKRLGIALAAAIALAIWAPSGYWKQMGTVLTVREDYNWTSQDGRRQVLMRGVSYMIRYPIFGLGMDNFEKAECSLSEKARASVNGAGVRCSAPHNSYIEAGSELGVFGLLLWSSLVLGGVVFTRRLRRRVPPSWRYGTNEQRFLFLAPSYLSMAMLGFAVTSLFLTFAWLEVVYLLAALIIGLYVSIDTALGSARSHTLPAEAEQHHHRMPRSAAATVSRRVARLDHWRMQPHG